MLREAPRVLLSFVLPRKHPDDPEEGLCFAIAAGTGELVVQVAMTEERFRSFTYQKPCSIPIPRDAALRLAHELLRELAPEVADFLERACGAAELRLVQGGAGAGGPEAA